MGEVGSVQWPLLAEMGKALAETSPVPLGAWQSAQAGEGTVSFQMCVGRLLGEGEAGSGSSTALAFDVVDVESFCRVLFLSPGPGTP